MQPSIRGSAHQTPFLHSRGENRPAVTRAPGDEEEGCDHNEGDREGADAAKNRSLASASFSRHALRVRPYIYKLTYRLMGNHTEAEDITQETFVRAWMNYPAFDVTRPFEAWVYRIAVNLCLDAKRRQARQPSVSLEWSLPNGGDAARLELSDTTFDPERCLLDLEVDDRLTTEIGALPSTYRACVLLLAQGHSYEQLATLLNCPLGTIRSRIHRARAQLRRTLKCSSAALPG